MVPYVTLKFGSTSNGKSTEFTKAKYLYFDDFLIIVLKPHFNHNFYFDIASLKFAKSSSLTRNYETT